MWEGHIKGKTGISNLGGWLIDLGETGDCDWAQGAWEGINDVFGCFHWVVEVNIPSCVEAITEEGYI